MNSDDDSDTGPGGLLDEIAEEVRSNQRRAAARQPPSLGLTDEEGAALTESQALLVNMLEALGRSSGVKQHEITLRMLAEELLYVADRLYRLDRLDCHTSDQLH